jgi:hypothetical protein
MSSSFDYSRVNLLTTSRVLMAFKNARYEWWASSLIFLPKLFTLHKLDILIEATDTDQVCCQKLLAFLNSEGDETTFSGRKWHVLTELFDLNGFQLESCVFPLIQKIKLALEFKIKYPNERIEAGLSPLSMAIQRKDIELVKSMMHYQPDAAWRDKNNHSALHYALQLVEKGDVTFLDTLTRNTTFYPDTVHEGLCAAIMHQEEKLFSYWLLIGEAKKYFDGGHVGRNSILNKKDQEGRTPLYLAIAKKNYWMCEQLKQLMQRNAPVKVPAPQSQQPSPVVVPPIHFHRKNWLDALANNIPWRKKAAIPPNTVNSEVNDVIELHTQELPVFMPRPR